MNRRAAGALAALLVAAFVSMVPGSALAASPVPEIRSSPTPTPRLTPSPLPSPHATPGENLGLRASILSAIDRRLIMVRSLRATVGTSKALSEPDRAALGGQLDAVATGLAALAVKVTADTDLTVLRKDAAAVVNDYRVEDLLVPKVRLVIAADTALHGAASLTQLATRLLAAISREKAAGRDTQAAEADVAEMQARIAAANQAAGGVPAMVLPLTPAGFPGNRATLGSARAAIATAGSSLHAAGEAAHRAAGDLKLLTRADLKASGRKMIDERLKVLARLTAEVRAAGTLTQEDRVGLLTLMSTDQSGLTALGRRLESESDLKALEADIKSIYTDFRIYALVVPKVELVMAADGLSAGTTRLDAVGRRIAELVARARAAGRETAVAEVALAALVSHDDAARARLTGVGADLLSLTTADYPGNGTALAGDRRAIEDARGELAAAARDARLALEALK